MSKIFFRTIVITLLRFVLNVSPAAVFIFGVLFLRNLFIRWDMHVITHLMTIPIALGLGAAYSRTVVRFFDFLLRLAHTIAVTVVVLDQPYKGTLTGYAWKEATRNLIGNTATSMVTIKGVKLVKTLKTALLEKTILNHLNDPGGFSLGHSLFKFIVYNINMALDSMDEVLVSYTWFTQELFRRHWEMENPKKKISIKTRVKNQAKYFLEGTALYIRVLPRMLVNNTLYIVAIEIFIFLTLAATVILTTISLGFGWWNILFMFITTRLILIAVNWVIVPSLRVNVAIWQFYNQVSKLETTTPDFIRGLVGKLPPLAWVAKQTGDPEYKDEKVTLTEADNPETCAGDIVDWAECEEALRGLVNDTAKIFQVHEKDILEPCGGKQEEAVSDTLPAEEQVFEEVPHQEPEEIPHQEQEETFPTEETPPEGDEDSLFDIKMPAGDIPSSVIKKVDFGGKMSDLVDVDDLI